ncbi:MAG: isoprenylcysteine carboxylmethyltransferase family protein, partial [Cyanobacteria bacterium J083]
IIGIVMVLASAFLFKQKNTTIKPLEESTYLVQEGLFKYSRNPIYLGMTISLLGVGLFLGSLTPFFVIPLFVWLIQTLFIEQEEKMLEEKFGDEYRQYKQKVRRWV